LTTGQSRPAWAGGGGPAGQDGGEGGLGVLALKRGPAGHRGVEGDAEGPQIARRGRRLAVDPLRREIRRGADHLPGGGQRGRVVDRGDAEVGQHHPVRVVEEDVGGFDVAVGDPRAVRGTQRVEDLQADLRGSLLGQQAVFPDGLRQGTPIDQLHDDPRPALVGDHVIHGHDAGMPQPGGGLGLAQRPPDQRVRRIDRSVPRAREPDLLDGDVPAQQGVVRVPDRAHATAPQRPHQPIAADDHPRHPLGHTGNLSGPGETSRGPAVAALVDDHRYCFLYVVGLRNASPSPARSGLCNRRSMDQRSCR